MIGKEYLKDLFRYAIYRLDHDCTDEEADSFADAAKHTIKLYARIKDLANYYDKPEVNVRNVIHRKLIDKPKREVYYDFNKFNEIVPDSWRKKNSED